MFTCMSYHSAQLSCTTQHRTVLIIFPPNLETIILAQMLFIGRGGCRDFPMDICTDARIPTSFIEEDWCT